MTGVDIYRLVLETLTAFGTVGAVSVALWTVLRKQAPFAIRDVQVSGRQMMRTGSPVGDREWALRLSLENFRDTQMQVFDVSIEADHSKDKNSIHEMGVSFSEPNTFIPQRSIYGVEYKIGTKSIKGTYSQAKEIRLTVSTSFGTQTVSFPRAWRHQLFMAMEEVDPTMASPFDTPSAKKRPKLLRNICDALRIKK